MDCLLGGSALLLGALSEESAIRMSGPGYSKNLPISYHLNSKKAHRWKLVTK